MIGPYTDGKRQRREGDEAGLIKQEPEGGGPHSPGPIGLERYDGPLDPGLQALSFDMSRDGYGIDYERFHPGITLGGQFGEGSVGDSWEHDGQRPNPDLGPDGSIQGMPMNEFNANRGVGQEQMSINQRRPTGVPAQSLYELAGPSTQPRHGPSTGWTAVPNQIPDQDAFPAQSRVPPTNPIQPAQYGQGTGKQQEAVHGGPAFGDQQGIEHAAALLSMAYAMHKEHTPNEPNLSTSHGASRSRVGETAGNNDQPQSGQPLSLITGFAFVDNPNGSMANAGPLSGPLMDGSSMYNLHGLYNGNIEAIQGMKRIQGEQSRPLVDDHHVALRQNSGGTSVSPIDLALSAVPMSNNSNTKYGNNAAQMFSGVLSEGLWSLPEATVGLERPIGLTPMVPEDWVGIALPKRHWRMNTMEN